MECSDSCFLGILSKSPFQEVVTRDIQITRNCQIQFHERFACVANAKSSAKMNVLDCIFGTTSTYRRNTIELPLSAVHRSIFFAGSLRYLSKHKPCGYLTCCLYNMPWRHTVSYADDKLIKASPVFDSLRLVHLCSGSV